MIAALLLLAAAAPATPVEAERAFAADAQALGQWTAFRKWAAPDAIFLPPKGTVHDALKDAPDPPKSVVWWPTASFLSCDGMIGANTGGALWPGGRHSYFSTIWAKQTNGDWRYRLDHGDDLTTARPRPAADRPAIRRASCRGRPPMLESVFVQGVADGGWSPDRTLVWQWTLQPGGGHAFVVKLWTGARYEPVITDRVAPKPGPAA